MKMQRILLVLLLGAACISGCASKMKVKVELLNPSGVCADSADFSVNPLTSLPYYEVPVRGASPNDKEMSDQARFRAAIELGLRALNRYKAAFLEIPAAVGRPAFSRVTEKYVPDYQQLKDLAEKKTAEYVARGNALLEGKERIPEDSTRVFTRTVYEFLMGERETWGNVIFKAEADADNACRACERALLQLSTEKGNTPADRETVEKNKTMKTAEKADLEQFKTTIAAILAEHTKRTAEYLNTALRATSGNRADNLTSFGGFQTCSVHPVTPSDPFYRAVLRARTIGHPFTKAVIHGLGSSTMVIVQETPTQFHVQSVDTDASVLIQNVVDISSKVMEAWVKYMGTAAKAAL